MNTGVFTTFYLLKRHFKMHFAMFFLLERQLRGHVSTVYPLFVHLLMVLVPTLDLIKYFWCINATKVVFLPEQNEQLQLKH